MVQAQSGSVIIESAGKVLLLRRAFDPGKGKLDIPGGAVNEGESVEQAAVREAKEETGFDVELVKKIDVVQVAYRGQTVADNIFLARIAEGAQLASAEGELEWIDVRAIFMQDLAFPEHLEILSALSGNL